LKRIAIFASGGGSNALKFLEYFDDIESVEIALVVSNKRSAGVLDHAKAYDVPTLVMDKSYFRDRQCILEVLAAEKIEIIVLAGFLWLIPPYLIKAFPEKIVNIHPALLPKYGGKGMYGQHVHEAVKANGESLSGMTIHLVNEKYDEGRHLYQATCNIQHSDSAKDIAQKVLALEHEHYARVVHEQLCS